MNLSNIEIYCTMLIMVLLFVTFLSIKLSSENQRLKLENSKLVSRIESLRKACDDALSVAVVTQKAIQSVATEHRKLVIANGRNSIPHSGSHSAKPKSNASSERSTAVSSSTGTYDRIPDEDYCSPSRSASVSYCDGSSSMAAATASCD